MALAGEPADGIVVRAATPADAGPVAEIYAPVVDDTAISFEETPPGPDEIGRRMLASPRLPWLVADDGGHIAGYAYASAHRQRPAYRWSADSSVYLDPRYRSRGLGRRLYERLIGEVRDLGYVSLFAGIALPNAPSVRAARGDGLPSGGGVQQRRLQAGLLAGRRLVAAPAA